MLNKKNITLVLASAAAVILLAVTQTRLSADSGRNPHPKTSFTGTGWLIAAPEPGVLCTDARGRTFLKGNVHVVRTETDETRLVGRMHAWMDMTFQADGTATFGGPACCVLGTWDLSDPTNPKFTPTEGVWEIEYAGVVLADGSSKYVMTGRGIGGPIDGLRVKMTGTRTSSDASSPYVMSGSIYSSPGDDRHD